MSEPWDFRVFLRELNTRFRNLVNVVNQNYESSGHSNVIFVTSVNGTLPVWLVGTGGFRIDSVSAVCSAGTGSLTPRIGGVNVGGAPFSVTTTPTHFAINSLNDIVDLDLLDIITSGLTGSLTLSFELRRIR